MGIIPKVKTQKETIIIEKMYEFGTNGVGLRVKRRLDVLYV